MKNESRPSLLSGTTVVVLLTAIWAYLRLVVFSETALPLTFVIPMLVCVWTCRPWHVWSMAMVFAAGVILKFHWLLPAGALTPHDRTIFFGTSLFNVLAGAIVIHVMIGFRLRLVRQNERLAAQNAELESQSEELVQQNEEIKVQSEELVQQNEEIESQSEELTRQNEELQESAERLSHREDVLQTLVESARTPETGREALGLLARRSLAILGAPAECVAVFRRDGDWLRLKAQAAVPGGPVVPDWPIGGSVAGAVLNDDRTAYVSDLAGEPGLAAPFGPQGVVRSILATPLHVAGRQYGLVVAASTRAGHWTQEQFRMVEWISAQAGLIAEALRWQNALADRAREIEEANHAKDQFLAMLSHELRTPLTPVLAAAGVLEHDPRLPADVRGDIAMIRRNVAIQSRLIDDLLDVTRLGRGKLDLELQTLSLPELLRETVAIVGPDLDAKNQTLLLDLSLGERGRLRGDSARLHQVFWNLLRNANKYSPPGARIWLSTRSITGPEPRIAVDVRDEGMGIAPADLARIFRPFEQVTVHARTTATGGGLGLGLAIAKAIVELHHGTIVVASEGQGRGSRFTVELPLAAEAPPAPRVLSAVPADQVANPRERPPLRILLVEDHGDTGRILARLLRNAGHYVEHAETAGAALSRFEQTHFDLLVSDLGLPDESGIELMRKLRARRPDLIGICLSGYAMEQDLRACREAGFAEHLTKPVDMQRLHAAIARNCADFVTKN